ncbi:MAG: glucose-6-phosphate isomerase [Bacteroidales bacterium]|nr:glucose-6-phosphate isomerase [Bacteroidales bacterium]
MSVIKLNTARLEPQVTQDEINQIWPEIKAAKQTLIQGTGAGNDFLGWVNLPTELDPTIVKEIKNQVHRIATEQKIEAFVVIGIGGSYLGARAVIEALQSEFAFNNVANGKPLVVYAGHTLSEDYCHQLLEFLDTKNYAVAVISKSGTTTEPAVAFRIVREHLEKKYGRTGAAERIIAITDKQRGALHDIAQQEHYPAFVIPDNVGGRFSVLTPVGLLPIAMAGYDIDALLEGAKEMRQMCLDGDTPETNPAMLYAACRNILYRKDKKVEMLVNFVPNLRYISEWWKQLYGESEGKDGKGILPHSLSFTTDLHSMGQYVQQGERTMFETVISVDHPLHEVTIPSDEKNLDGINFLVGKHLNDINRCAEQGTIIAHHNGGVPVLQISLPHIDERVLGQLIYFFEFACGVSGYTLGVNPFDQPGVEAYKKNMFALMGKPGYENYKLQ